MLRSKAIALIVRNEQGVGIFRNMQPKGVTAWYSYDGYAPTLTSAMGLGGGQTPVLLIEL